MTNFICLAACDSFSARPSGEDMHAPLASTLRTARRPSMHVCITFGSVFPPCAPASVGIATKTRAAAMFESLIRTSLRQRKRCGIRQSPRLNTPRPRMRRDFEA